MAILSVSLPPELVNFIDQEIMSGEFESKGQVIKKALKKLQEEIVVERILRASREARNGKVLRGNLRELAKSKGL